MRRPKKRIVTKDPQTSTTDDRKKTATNTLATRMPQQKIRGVKALRAAGGLLSGPRAHSPGPAVRPNQMADHLH